MLSATNKKNLDFYRHPNGMLNVAWIAGFIRGAQPGARMFYLQQTNNENLMIPIHLKDGDFIPSEFHDSNDPNAMPIPVRVICHIGGTKTPGVKEGVMERVVKITAIGFDRATILDMPPTTGFMLDPVAGAPVSKDLNFRPFTSSEKMSDSSNTVRVAGFVHSVVMNEVAAGETADCAIIYLQIAEDEDTLIPVRYYNKRMAQVVARNLEPGHPIVIYGQARVRAKPVGEIDPETGLAPVLRFPYIHCENPPAIATNRDIVRTPPWAVKRLTELAEKRRQRSDKSARRATTAAAQSEVPGAAGIETKRDLESGVTDI